MAVDKLVDSAQLDGYFTNIADAIRTKASTASTYTPPQMPQAILDIPSGGGGDEPKVVHFIDYDGTVLYSYTASEAQALQDLPPNPSHERLVAQGWNYTLSELKAEVAAVGSCHVGQLYITASGATEIDIEMEHGGIKAYLNFSHTGTSSNIVTIDWGDGSEPETASGTVTLNRPHTYTTGGKYTIKISTQGIITISGASTSSTGSKLLWTNSNGSANRGIQALIKGVYFGDHAINLSSYALAYCGGLTTVSMSNKVRSIEGYAIQYCSKLRSITIPNNVTSIGSNAFQSCFSITSIVLPNTVTNITSTAFAACYSLTSFTIPSAVTIINSYIFNNCFSLRSITIPNGVTTIGMYAFQSCYSLTSVDIPSTVTSIGNNAFTGCYSLMSIDLPSSLTSIGSNVFNGCYGLTSITIPSGVSQIANNTFQNCYSLTSITIPSSVTSIGDNAFQYCYSLTSINIPNGVTSIGQRAFQFCYSLTSINIPSSVTVLNTYAFNNCYNLTSITIPNSVTRIGDYVFQYCYSLTTVTIPSDVTSIGNYVFQYCYLLNDIHVRPVTPPTLGTGVFSATSSNHVIYVPTGTLADYQAAANWNQYTAVMVEETA